MTFHQDMERWVQKTGLKLENVIKATCMQLTEGIVMRTPVLTGRARGNWIATINYPSAYAVLDEDPEGANTIAKASGTAGDAPGNVFYLVNNVPYARALEFGHSRQAPQGMVRVTVHDFNRHLKKAVADER
jgi:hypothetical protein